MGNMAPSFVGQEVCSTVAGCSLWIGEMGQGLSALVATRHGGLPRATLRRPAPVPSGLEVAELSFDRDLSLIEFYRRVFDEACDEANPLLERVKFLGIVGTILHEFAVTRYAELARTAHLKQVEAEVEDLLADARLHLREQLAPALAREGIHLLRCANMLPKERAEVDAYFTESVLPLLMPLGFDAARPFPHITGRTIALAVIVRDVRNGGREHFACVQVPDALPALVAVKRGFVWLDEVVSEHLAAVFPGMDIVQVHPIRVVRDASLGAERPEDVTVPDAVTQGLRDREYGEVLVLVVGE